MKKIKFDRDMLRRASVVFFWVIFLALGVLFFTNDFGIVDIHKTSIIVSIGIDATENEVQVTAQLAVPKPSQSGDNIEYVQVQGSGETVADALNEINAKTGYYPQLNFCKLVLLGDSIKEKNLFRTLGCLYRKNYSELTALVAMCDGNASEMLAMPTVTDNMSTTVIQRALADELKKSANVSTATLKSIAETGYSKSGACYMPYVEASLLGTSEEGGNGDSVGGEEPKSNNSPSGQSSSSSGGEGSSSGGGGSQSQSGEKKPVEFTARRTAIFKDGVFLGVLDEQQAFALDILKNEIRLAILPCDTEKYHYTLGLGKTKGGIKVKVVDDEVEVTLSFKAFGRISGIKKVVDLEETAKDDTLSHDVKEAANKTIEQRFASLIDLIKETDCDILGIREDLYRYNYSKYAKLKDDALKNMRVKYDIDVKSVNE